MNRFERRKMSKKLGIMRYQQKLPRNKRFNLMYENIIEGKKIQKEVAEEVRKQTDTLIEEKTSQIITHLAEDIAKRKKIPIIDAMKEAEKEYYQMGKK
jgi:3-hydroxyacyl-CoA dehydrogenase